MSEEANNAGGLPPSAFALVVANLVPVLGVVLAGWDTFTVVLLYWLETAVIGLLTLARIATAKGDASEMVARIAATRGIDDSKKEALESAMSKNGAESLGGGGAMRLFLMPFFCVHFGIFMSVHLMFITTLIGGGGLPDPSFSPIEKLRETLGSPSPWIWISLLCLLGSHAFSFFTNYLGRGEYLRTVPALEMMRPYGRVVLMHIAIILGAFLTLALGSSLAILLLLVLGKMIIDLKFHLKAHRKRLAQDASEAAVF